MLRFVRCLAYAVLCLGICLPAACSGQGGSAEDGYRTFTDSRGRTVQARVLQVDGDQVTIQRRDGKRFTVPIATFSPADQEFLRGPASAKTDTAKTAKTKTAKAKPAGAGSRDWNRFRGPTGMGVADATGLPVEWSQDDGLVWKTALPGAGASSPVTFGDRIYLTCYTGFFVPDEPGGSPEELKRHLIALRLDDGQVVWDKAVPAKLPEEERIRDHGFAASSVAVDEERIYVFFGKTGVFAFDHDGNQLWQADVGSKTNGWGSAASPVLYKDLVFINASVESESLVALDRKTGEEKWRAGGIREAWNTPVVVTAASGREELVIPTAGTVYAFAPDSGESLWSCKTDIGWYMVPSVVAADGVVYCLGGRSGTAALAVRAGGSGDVTATHRLWTSLKGSNVSSPDLPGRAPVLDARVARDRVLRQGRNRRDRLRTAAGTLRAILRLGAAGRRPAVLRDPERQDLRAGRQAAIRAVGRQRPVGPRRLQRQSRRGRQPLADQVGQVPVLRGGEVK